MKKAILIIIATLILAITVQQAMAASITITSTPQTTAVLNKEYTYQVEASNIQGAVTYALAEAPQNMQISSTTGLITWTPGSTGTFNINVTATDDNSTASQSFSITVASAQSRFDAGHLTLGSDTQRRDETITQTWTITNQGSFPITNIEASTTGVATRYEFSLSLPSTTLQPGQSVEAVATIYVPENQDAGDRRLGSVTLTGDSQDNVSPLTRDIRLEAQNNLVIEEVEVRVAGRRDRMTSPGMVDRRAELGDEIDIRVRVRNTFDENIDIDDVELEVFSNDLLDADGLDDFISRLRRDRTSDLNINFILDPREVEPLDAPFRIELRVTGIDENNAVHGETWEIELDMDTPTRDLKIIDARMNPSSLACNERMTTVEVEVRNTGRRDLDRATIRYRIPEFGIDEYQRDIEVYEGEIRRLTRSLTLPANMEAGTYFLYLEAHTLPGTQTDTETLTLTVQGCPTTPPEEEETVVTPPIDVIRNETTVIGTPISRETGVPARDTILGLSSDAYIVLLGVLLVVLVIVVIMLLVTLGRKQ